MNSFHDPADPPDGEPRPNGTEGGPPNTPIEGPSSSPQRPFDERQNGQRAIDGPATTGSPGGGGLIAGEITALLVWAAVSFVFLDWFLNLFERNGWLPMALWLVSGLIVIWPGSDGLIAKYLLGLRHPTMVENQRLAGSWYAVADRAGIDVNSYTVWIQNSEAATSSVTGGNTVAVTRWALYTLPPHHLEAVLAHSLAAHRRGRGWLSRLLHWYSVPARAIGLILRLLVRLSRTTPAIGCTIIGFLLLAYLGLFLAMLIFFDSLTVPLMFILPLFSPLLIIAVNKLVERMADRGAGDLGYGRRLLEVFYGWQVQHEGAQRQAGGFMQPERLSGDGSVAERIRALEVYLQRRGWIAG